MKVAVKFALLILLFVCAGFYEDAKAQTTITDYKLNFGTADYEGKSLILLREFKKGEMSYYLTVSPQDMTTKIIAGRELSGISLCTFQELGIRMANTPYIKALQQAQAQALPLQNAGITHAFPKEKGITLTIDLCPSHKGLDRSLFISLMNSFNNIERPIPVALSITGRFLFAHNEDIQWLKNMVSSGQINITWVNHTFNHHYNPSSPFNENFLLTPGTDLNSEILNLEHALLEQEMLPSVFFRFPGLISDQQLVDRVTGYGLIPIGSDAWLAKGEQPKAGSLVLIHGNGNEPIGVQDFIKLLGKEEAAVQQKQWLLYDLRSSVSNEF